MSQDPVEPPSLLDRTLAAVCEAHRCDASTLDYKYWRNTDGLDAPRLDVWFVVATDTDLAFAERKGLRSRLDEATRDALARSGYLRETGDVVMVTLHARESIERLGYSYFY